MMNGERSCGKIVSTDHNLQDESPPLWPYSYGERNNDSGRQQHRWQLSLIERSWNALDVWFYVFWFSHNHQSAPKIYYLTGLNELAEGGGSWLGRDFPLLRTCRWGCWLCVCFLPVLKQHTLPKGVKDWRCQQNDWLTVRSCLLCLPGWRRSLTLAVNQNRSIVHDQSSSTECGKSAQGLTKKGWLEPDFRWILFWLNINLLQ